MSRPRGLRVIAGSARGRRLVAPEGDQVRPTKDIAREAMFSALDARGALDDATVLDLYAGTGALAIEALSRGAAAAVLVERDRAALDADPRQSPGARPGTARRSVAAVDVVARDVGRFLAGGPPPDAPFDLVFVDPPYDTPDEEVTALLASLLAPGWLALGSIVSVERPVRHPVVVPPGLSNRLGADVRRYAFDLLVSMTGGDCVATALCPGSFDPVTLGHLDIIERSSRHFDEVIVAVIRNPQKTQSLFSLEDRQQMLKEATQHLPNIRIEFFKGLLVDFARDHGVDAIVKGLRAVSDFDQELQMAQMNQRLSGIDTFFLSTSPQHSFLSSSLVREVARFGGDVSGMVPKNVNDRLVETFRIQEV